VTRGGLSRLGKSVGDGERAANQFDVSHNNHAVTGGFTSKAICSEQVKSDLDLVPSTIRSDDCDLETESSTVRVEFKIDLDDHGEYINEEEMMGHYMQSGDTSNNNLLNINSGKESNIIKNMLSTILSRQCMVSLEGSVDGGLTTCASGGGVAKTALETDIGTSAGRAALAY